MSERPSISEREMLPHGVELHRSLTRPRPDEQVVSVRSVRNRGTIALRVTRVDGEVELTPEEARTVATGLYDAAMLVQFGHPREAAE